MSCDVRTSLSTVRTLACCTERLCEGQGSQSAKGDLEALRNVFDSNGDGKLDASDAKFNQFKVMVTNSDGSYTAKTLTELGITALNLKADLTDIKYTDGSEITWQTTTSTEGTTGGLASSLNSREHFLLSI